MATDISQDTLNKETDALFWAQTGYKVGQKLDPSLTADKAYGPVWMDIYRKVKRAADDGTLVTTFDHPVVEQHLSDAVVASKAAAAHLDAAVAASDPATTQANVLAATTATQISAQKAREAAANQPPTVSPALVQEAGKAAVKTPPPPSAPSSAHIAHAHAHAHAHGHHVPLQEEQQARTTAPEVLYKETNLRFWRQTGYKPGQKLDQANAQDREKAKIWMAIFRQVQHEAAAGALVLSSPEPTPSPMPLPPWVVRPPRGPRPPMVQPYPQMPPYQPYPQMPPFQQYPQGQPYPQMPPFQQYPQGQSYQPYPQMPPQMQQPHPPNGHERGRHGRGHGRGQHPSSGPLGPQPGGQAPPDISAPTGAPVFSSPSPGGFPPSEGAPPADVPGAPSSPDTTQSPPPEEPSSIGKYLAIGLAIVAGGGLLYYATSHKSPRRTPKVLLATPTRPTSRTALSRP